LWTKGHGVCLLLHAGNSLCFRVCGAAATLTRIPSCAIRALTSRETHL
jgi:hypothetical protein